MGIFTRKKDKETKNLYIIRDFLNTNLSSIVRTYANSIYDIPEVRTAIDMVADIISTVPVYHKIENKDGTARYKDDDIGFVLNIRPNVLQNSSQFWRTVIKKLLLNSNVFIEPMFAPNGKLEALYPLPTKHFEFKLYPDRTKAEVVFYDKPRGNPLESYNMENLIYLNKFSDIDGGASPEMGLYEEVIKALETQILQVTDPQKIKAFLQGVTGQVPNIKDKDKKGTMANFAANLDSNVRGVAYIDPQWKITPVNWQENDVNRELMMSVINTVQNYFGMTNSIIQHDITEIQRENFIVDKIKPITMQMEKEFTYKLFTRDEIKAGHRIEFDVFALSVSTLQAKNALFGTAARNGILCSDEMREIMGYSALPNGKGQRYAVSADCVSIENVDKYQLNKVGNKLVSTDLGADDIKNSNKEEES